MRGNAASPSCARRPPEAAGCDRPAPRPISGAARGEERGVATIPASPAPRCAAIGWAGGTSRTPARAPRCAASAGAAIARRSHTRQSSGRWRGKPCAASRRSRPTQGPWRATPRRGRGVVLRWLGAISCSKVSSISARVAFKQKLTESWMRLSRGRQTPAREAARSNPKLQSALSSPAATLRPKCCRANASTSVKAQWEGARSSTCRRP